MSFRKFGRPTSVAKQNSVLSLAFTAPRFQIGKWGRVPVPELVEAVARIIDAKPEFLFELERARGIRQ